MRPDEGRLQTAEHILAKILESRLADIVVGISKFKEGSGLLEITSKTDPRTLDVKNIEDEVNGAIARGLHVDKLMLSREEAGKQVNLRKVPDSVTEVRVIDIVGFDKRPCRDPHVNNTEEIGHFKILRLDKAGKDRYRFTFAVE